METSLFCTTDTSTHSVALTGFSHTVSLYIGVFQSANAHVHIHTCTYTHVLFFSRVGGMNVFHAERKKSCLSPAKERCVFVLYIVQYFVCVQFHSLPTKSF